MSCTLSATTVMVDNHPVACVASSRSLILSNNNLVGTVPAGISTLTSLS